MPTDRIEIPGDLLQLKPSDDLDSVSLAEFTRTSTSVLQKMLEMGQAVTVNIQGGDGVVAVSARQYDEMVDLICQIQQKQSASARR